MTRGVQAAFRELRKRFPIEPNMFVKCGHDGGDLAVGVFVLAGGHDVEPIWCPVNDLDEMGGHIVISAGGRWILTCPVCDERLDVEAESAASVFDDLKRAQRSHLTMWGLRDALRFKPGVVRV
ncbi:hypothetical protein EG850_11160 [Gulosibacter macacae]|uniref:Uncharacterized protein n=1 Tax=Gulosibacter macacae TaxID=2488791 RepID=A0A3P3VUD4_9MICO|nr:hypothetical protein [Gulosibacter macacae]RRJ85937.1 hypothetical protein EG850_11160 [Gulosibacter macacae]